MDATFRYVVDRSGFTRAELAEIYGTTRQTIYNWYGGTEPKQRALASRAASASALLKVLITATRPVLPFPDSLDGATRRARIDKIVLRVIREARP